jgi:hypothetical protein
MGKYSFHLLRKCSLTPLSTQRPPSGLQSFRLYGHYISSSNQTSRPELFAEPVVTCRTAPPLRKHLWAVESHPYLAFCDKSPFQGELFGLLGGLVDAMHLDHTGWHLPHRPRHRKIVEGARTNTAPHCTTPEAVVPRCAIFEPKFPSAYGYFSCHSTENAARSDLRRSMDAFAVYFAYVSFLVAVGQFTGKPSGTPAWLTCLEAPDVLPPEFLDNDHTVPIYTPNS